MQFMLGFNGFMMPVSDDLKTPLDGPFTQGEIMEIAQENDFVGNSYEACSNYLRTIGHPSAPKRFTIIDGLKIPDPTGLHQPVFPNPVQSRG